MLRRLALALGILLLTFGAAFGADAAAKPKPKPKAPPPTRGVVLINTNLALENASAAGTGIVLTKSGEVLTNNHVIRGATTISVTVPATKRTYSATVVGYDISDDVAVLQLQGASKLATATFGNSAKLRIGQLTRAVGNANGGGRLVLTKGKVLALDQTIQVQQDDGEVAQLGSLVETSARLVPGDSGGPLLDGAGRVIGMDAAGSPTFAVNASAPGYAIAIEHALTVVRQIVSQQASTLVHIGPTAFIGVQVQDTQAGVVVAGIVPGTPAETSGIAAGDVVTSVDGAPVTSLGDIRAALFAHHPGDTITVGYTDPTGAAGTATIALADGPPQ